MQTRVNRGVNDLSSWNEVEVALEICREGAKIPEYSRPGDAGMDVCAAEDVEVKPGETVIIPTGLKLAIPMGYEVQVRPRSGLSLNTPLRISNSPGTVDSGYRDELGIILTNMSEPGSGARVYTLDQKGNSNGTYMIRKGDRVAQLVLQAVPRMKFTVVESVSGIGQDRGGGFGSTGIG